MKRTKKGGRRERRREREKERGEGKEGRKEDEDDDEAEGDVKQEKLTVVDEVAEERRIPQVTSTV